MLKKLVILVFLFVYTAYAEFDYSIENTNFTISQDRLRPDEKKESFYNYDRLRFRSDYVQESYFTTIIADMVNYLGYGYINSVSHTIAKAQKADTPFETQSSYRNYGEGEAYVKLYRLYGGFEDGSNRVVLGLQNITMGVGRIWTPSNLFNPKNTYAFEPDEVFGVAALTYTIHLNETSNFTAVVSQKRDKSYKYALRYKSFLEYADVALSTISSDDTSMLAYELEGNLADTGIELRSEGTYIKSSLKSPMLQNEEKEFFQGIVGADYGFENGLTLVAEALYSSESFDYDQILLNLQSDVFSDLRYSKFYLGTTLSYSLNIFLDASLVYIESFNEHNSRFISPSLRYTLNDFNTFSLGAMLKDGPGGSEFGDFGNSYYFKYVFTF